VCWKLSEAVLRCCVRRAFSAAAAAPLVALIVAATLLAVPLFALVSGRQLAGLVAVAGVDPALATAFAATIVGPALVLGMALAALAPGDRAVGSTLAPAPVGAGRRFFHLTLLPLGVVFAVLAIPAAVGAAAASTAAPAGRWLAAAVVASLAAATAFGAACADAATAAARSLRWTPLLGALAIGWLAAGTAAAEPLLGPVALLARAAGGDVASALGATLACALLALVAGAIWAVANAQLRFPHRRARAPRVSVSISRGPRRAVATIVTLRLVRNGQVRRHVGLACLCSLAAGATGRAFGAGESAASYLPLTVALVAAVAVPPAAVALRRDGAWLLRTGVLSAPSAARAGAAAAVAAAAATFLVVLLAAAPVAVLEPGAWPLAETSAAVVIAAAVIGGALAPWRPDGIVDQAVSYVVVAGIAAALSYALARGAASAAVIGVPEAVFAAAAANAAVVVAVALAGALER
jgi:hypothetical protein